MAFSDIFTQSFETLRKYPKAILPYLALELVLVGLVFAVLFGVFHVQPGMMMVGTTGMAAVGPYIGAIFAVIAIEFLIGIFVTPLFYGVYSNLQIQKLKKQRLSLSSAYKTAKSRYAALFWGGIITLLMYLTVIIIFIGLLVLFIIGSHAVSTLSSSAATGSLRAVFGIIGLAFLWIILLLVCLGALGVLLYQWVPAAIVERKGAVAAIARSIEIGKENFWRIVGMLVIYGIIAGAVSLAVALVSLPFSLISHVAQASAEVILSIITGSVINTFYILLMPSFYNNYVKRIR